ncbi:hypothetical protein [Glycomyces sp. NRRL B-16210]|uniref:hypothetical protein n=1 Tax=Glycomyces sp. NRRL B-16210 TaxID=1463821 RepID=UPI00068D7D5A|nr:hypothetical protein [Glycomyces sp. NRRL B-16210]
MPTKTGDKVRIIVLGTGPDAETVRLIAESDADVALAAKFTKTVTHLVIDDTVKPTEARVKKAEEAGVPVLNFAEFKALLKAGDEDEVDEPAETEAEFIEAVEAETAEAEADAVEAEAAAESEVVEAAVEAATVEPEVVEPEVVEPEPVAEAEPVVETPAEVVDEPAAAPPVAEAIEEPEEAAADPEKTVPSQAEAPEIESERSKPGLFAKIRSIFGKTGAKK